MILPPAEEYEKSVYVPTILVNSNKFKYLFFRLSFASLNYFGGKSESLLRESKKLSTLMSDNEDAMMVFISDLWLDKTIVHILIYFFYIYKIIYILGF